MCTTDQTDRLTQRWDRILDEHPSWSGDPMLKCFARGRLAEATDATLDRTVAALEAAAAVTPPDPGEPWPARRKSDRARHQVARAAYLAAMAVAS